MIMNTEAKTFIAVATLIAAAMLMTGYIANGQPVDEWGLGGLLFIISAGFWIWMWREGEAESMALVVQDDAPVLPKAQEWIISKDVVEATNEVEEEAEAAQAEAPTEDGAIDDTDVRAEVIEEVVEALPDDAEIVEEAKNGDPVAEAEVAEAMAAKPSGDPETTAEVINEDTDEPDDLERIEGIGEKYKDALIAAGISTFAELAAASIEDLEKAATDADMRRSSSMETWAEQAALAAANDWDGLDALQQELDGGRR